MAEKEPKKAGRGRPPKHPTGGHESGKRTGVAVNIRMDPALRALVPKFIAAFHQKHKARLDLTSTIEMALTKLFEEWELNPPPYNPEADEPAPKPEAK